MKQKEPETELHHSEKKGALKMEYEKKELDGRNSGSDDVATLCIRSGSTYRMKLPRNKDVSGWLDKSDNFAILKIVVLIIKRTGTTTIELISTEKAYLYPDPHAAID